MLGKRLYAIYFTFMIFTVFVSLRLFIISNTSTDTHEVLSGQYSRRLVIAERDGFIFDRNGELLSHTEDGYITYINPAGAQAYEYLELSKTLSSCSDLAQSYIYDKLFEGKPFLIPTNRAVTHKCACSYTRYEECESPFLCHILGYKNSDGKGVSGIRRAYGDYLDSISGQAFARYEADASGRILDDRPYGVYDVMYSEMTGVVLTIDKEIQHIAEQVAQEMMSMGAVVITDTSSGEIVACVSMPSYDPKRASDYLDSTKGEFINRAFSSYTPGSVFKCVVACAALEYDGSLYDYEYECTGKYDFEGLSISCHNKEGHGALSMREAFSESCNPYFISLALKIGQEKILDMAKTLGIGSYDDVNLIPASTGNLPSDNINLPANVANTAVGQGEVMLTPLQICSLVSTSVSGNYIKPSIVKGYMVKGELTSENKEKCEKVLSDTTVLCMNEMLRLCVTDGTGKSALSELVLSGGKTATSQSGQYKDGREVIHRIFAGVFPLENPRYSICVLCDGNGEENSNPSQIFKELCERITKENSP